MALLPKIKLKTLVSFPAAVFGGQGIAVRNVNGQYFFDLDFSQYPVVSSIPTPDQPNTNVLTYNIVSKAYLLAPYGGGGGSSVLPSTTVPLVESGAGAIGVSLNYARADHVHPAYGLTDAPSDGNTYGRKNAAWAAVSGGGVALGTFETKARVSLASGVPLTESDVAGAANIYVMPAGHSYTLLFDGTNDTPRSYAQNVVSLDTTNALAARNYDLWLAYSGGAVVAGYGPDWSAGAVAGSNATGGARGSGAGSTAYTMLNGRLVNANAITLRQNSATTFTIPAQQANLVGGFRCTANGLTEDSFLNRLVWNVLSVPRGGLFMETAANWVWSTAAFRQANANAAAKVAVLQGVPGRLLRATYSAFVGSSTATPRPSVVGLGLNSVTVNAAQVFAWCDCTGTQHLQGNADYHGYPGIGYNEFIPLEKGNGTDVQTWYGTTAGFGQSGLKLTVDL